MKRAVSPTSGNFLQRVAGKSNPVALKSVSDLRTKPFTSVRAEARIAQFVPIATTLRRADFPRYLTPRLSTSKSSLNHGNGMGVAFARKWHTGT